MTARMERAICSRINPEFSVPMKKQVLFYYPRFAEDESYDEQKIRSELGRVRAAISDAIYAGEPTEELLVRREALYLLAEDKGLM